MLGMCCKYIKLGKITVRAKSVHFTYSNKEKYFVMTSSQWNVNFWLYTECLSSHGIYLSTFIRIKPMLNKIYWRKTYILHTYQKNLPIVKSFTLICCVKRVKNGCKSFVLAYYYIDIKTDLTFNNDIKTTMMIILSFTTASYVILVSACLSFASWLL